MSIARTWYEELEQDVAELVRKLVYHDDPSDEQLEESVDLAEGYAIDALGLEQAARDRLEAAIAELERRITEADPRPKFLRMHDGVALAPRLQAFYDGRHADHQHHFLDDTEYAPYKLYVDFDAIANLMNPDFMAETIGAQYLEFANLAPSPDADPGECYAHLVIDPQTTTVYLVEPSGDPELIGEDLDAFLKRLKG